MWKRKLLIPFLALTMALVGVGSYAGVTLASSSDDSLPTVTTLAPASGWSGENLDVVITGTDFTDVTSVSFSEAGITVNSYTVDSDTQITADISIANDATIGTSDVSVTTSAGTATLSDSFTVETKQDAILDRAAEIYEENTGVAIDTDELQSAIDQARDEMQEQALQDRLDKLVAEGKITQDEADEYLAWWQARPDIEVPGLMGGHMGGHHEGGFGF